MWSTGALDEPAQTLPEYEGCPLVRFVGLLAGKWSIPILFRLILIDRPVRFSELQRSLMPITQKELTRLLRNFEVKRLVTRTVYAEVPPRVEYCITALGRTLREPLTGLGTWMLAYGDQVPSAQD